MQSRELKSRLIGASIARVVPHRESALSEHFELVCGLMICALMLLLIMPMLMLCMMLSVTLTLLSVALVGRRELEESLDTLEVQWRWPESVTRGEEAEFQLIISNPSRCELHRLEVYLRCPDGLSPPAMIDLSASTQCTLTGYLLCPHYLSGRVWGLELSVTDRYGLTRATRHLIHDLSTRVTPARPLISWGALIRDDARLDTPTSAHQATLKRGHDGDFSELRPYLPGDHWRAIAWRPSARLGQIMTRVLERNQERRYLIALDVSPAMRSPVTLGADETLTDLALDLALGWLPHLKGEQLGLVIFDHRVLAQTTVGPRARLQPQLEELVSYVTRPLDDDCTVDTLDELWSRVAHYLEWSGETSTQHDLKDRLSMYAFTPHLLTSSYQLGVVSSYLERMNLKGVLDMSSLDEVHLHNRLRKLFYLTGMTMRPCLPRPELEENQGMREMIDVARKERATHIIVLSSRERLESKSGRMMLKHWSRSGGVLQTLDMRRVSARKSSVTTHTQSSSSCRWSRHSSRSVSKADL